MNACAHRPDLRLARKSRERLDREVGDDLIEFPDEALIGAEHDGPNLLCI